MGIKPFLLFNIIIINAFSQAPEWQWAKNYGGGYEDKVTSIAGDALGNVFAVGYFGSPSITFDSNILTNERATYPSMFLVKYNASGISQGAIQTRKYYNNKANAVAADASGNIFVAGVFGEAKLHFGSRTFFTTLTNAMPGFDNMFLVKYDLTANVVWAKSPGGGSKDSIETSVSYLVPGELIQSKSPGGSTNNRATAVATDNKGNVIVAGSFEHTPIVFDSATLKPIQPDKYINTTFLVKYDVEGNALWAKSAVGSFINWPTAVATDSWGNIFVAGTFKGYTLAFDSIKLTNGDPVGFATNMFLVKYDSLGNVIWAKSGVSRFNNEAKTLKVDGKGNIFVAGSFWNSIKFDSLVLTNQGPAYAMYLVKYNASGNVVWANGAGGSSYDHATSVTIDASDNVIVAGDFRSPTIIFGSKVLKNVDTTGSTPDIFIAAYNTLGKNIWAKSIGGDDWDLASSITINSLGNIFIAGNFNSPTLTFDSITLTNNSTEKEFKGLKTDLFVAKLNLANKAKKNNTR